jgi:hypothetical protein
MANISASSYFDVLLTDGAPVEFQRRALKFAEDTKNVALMVKLAQLKSLDSEIDASLSKRGEADVLIAWASRPGRTTEELITRFAKEKRATLLSELAARTGLSETLYNELAKHTSVSVSVALLGNSAAPLTARLKASERAISSVRESYSTSYNVSSMFRDLPQEVRDHAVRFATTPAQISGLVDHLSDAAIRQAANHLAAMLRSKDVGWSGRSTLETIWEKLDTDARREFQVELANVVSEAAHISSTHFASEYVNRPVVDPVSDAIRMLAVETDSDEIRTLYATTVNASYQKRQEAFQAAIRNLNSPFDLLTSDLRWADESDMVALATRPDFDEDAALLLLSNRGGTEIFEIFSKVHDGEKLLRRLSGPNGEMPFWVEHVTMLRNNPKLALGLFNVNAALSNEFLIDEARKLILDRLGDDDKRWQTFQGLVGEWTSTLYSLLDAVEQLA